MKRLTIVLVALVVTMSFTGQALAKGKPPADRSPGTYNVTLSGGLNTTCEGEYIEMEGSIPGVLRADGVMLAMDLPIALNRMHDAGWGTDSETFIDDPCHGASELANVTGSYPGTLWLDFATDGTVTVRWRFDYFWEFGVHPKNGKLVQEVLEFFELTSTPIGTDGSGTFSVALFTKVGKEIVNLYVPVGDASGVLSVTTGASG